MNPMKLVIRVVDNGYTVSETEDNPHTSNERVKRMWVATDKIQLFDVLGEYINVVLEMERKNDNQQ